MDEDTRYNQERWEALASANVEWSRPMLNLTPGAARLAVDPYGVMDEVRGKEVLCLASGGGQQSVAFGLLGARVTVLDFSETQLRRDKEALAHYKLEATLVQGDMRDLSRWAGDTFDLVWHAFSINFIPDTRPVFDEVRRVLRPGRQYRVQWHNPFTAGLDETVWNGEGYPLKHRYQDGPIVFDSPYWDIYNADGTLRQIAGPREFNHTLGSVINGLVQRGFRLTGLWEELSQDPDATPGTWEHYKAFVPPWLTIWARLD